jgi:hypothetical protein
MKLDLPECFLIFYCFYPSPFVFDSNLLDMLISINCWFASKICMQKEWREHRDEFKKKVSRIVRRSQESF